MVSWRAAVVLAFLLGAGTASAQNARAGLGAWDTGRPSAEPWGADALRDKPDWTKVPQDQAAESFRGDAVVSNGRLTAVFRKASPAVEVYSADGVLRTRLVLQGPREGAARLERAALPENGRAAATVEAEYVAGKGARLAARFRLKRGEAALEVEPGAGAERLRVESPARHVVLPDFFADDILLDARRLSPATVEAPSDNFVLHLTGGGDAVVMCVLEQGDQDVRMTLAGEGDGRVVTGSEIPFGKKKVWVALLTGSRIWHSEEVRPEDAKKVRKLDWKTPFPAQWRVDFTRADELTDSWEMLVPDKEDEGYLKPGWLGAGSQKINKNRERWTTVLGSFKYPCWTDEEGRGYLQPLKHSALTLQGPAVIYPINRVPETPLDRFTVIDVARNTLGTGPCEYLLDLEGQRSQYRGRATCSVRDTLQPIYKNGQQKRKRADVEKALKDGHAFVTHIRGRIEGYMEFGRKVLEYLGEQRAARPEIAEPVAPLEKLARELEGRYAARKDRMKTPDHVAAMNDEFRKNLLDYDGEDAFDKCKAYTKALVEIGDNQDELVGECRWVVRALRQRAGLLMAQDPRLAAVAEEIRKRTQAVLRNPAGHEGARH